MTESKIDAQEIENIEVQELKKPDYIIKNNHNYSRLAKVMGENIKTEIHNAIVNLVDNAQTSKKLSGHQLHAMRKTLLNILKMCNSTVDKHVQLVQDAKEITLL